MRNDKKNADGAIADFTRALELDPNNALIYRARAHVYRDMGKATLAEADEKKALELGH